MRCARVEIDAENRRARVEAGALWEDVVVPATEQGLTALHGSSPNVGVVGYSLGGGIGWLARKHGLSAESVLAVEVVTADGTLLRADRTQNTDLFWALRGGGGGLGVVVAMEIALYEVEELVAGMMIWPWEQSADVLTAYVEWAETAPNSVSASARMLQIPPLPDIPEFLRGRQIVVIDGAVLGNEDEANEILAPFRALGPEIDTFATVPAAALMRLHMDPEPPMPGKGDGFLVDDLDADAVKAIVEIAGPGTDSPLMMVELRQLGGTLRERRPGAGALGSLDGSFAFFSVGVPMGPGAAEAIESRIDDDQGRARTLVARQDVPQLRREERDHRRCGRRRGVHAARAGQGVGRSGRPLPLRAHVRDGDGRGGRRGRRGVGRDLEQDRRRTRVSPGRREAPSAVRRQDRRRCNYPRGDSFRLI